MRSKLRGFASSAASLARRRTNSSATEVKPAMPRSRTVRRPRPSAAAASSGAAARTTAAARSPPVGRVGLQPRQLDVRQAAVERRLLHEDALLLAVVHLAQRDRAQRPADDEALEERAGDGRRRGGVGRRAAAVQRGVVVSFRDGDDLDDAVRAVQRRRVQRRAAFALLVGENRRDKIPRRPEHAAACSIPHQRDSAMRPRASVVVAAARCVRRGCSRPRRRRRS